MRLVQKIAKAHGYRVAELINIVPDAPCKEEWRKSNSGKGFSVVYMTPLKELDYSILENAQRLADAIHTLYDVTTFVDVWNGDIRFHIYACCE